MKLRKIRFVCNYVNEESVFFFFLGNLSIILFLVINWFKKVYGYYKFLCGYF